MSLCFFARTSHFGFFTNSQSGSFTLQLKHTHKNTSYINKFHRFSLPSKLKQLQNDFNVLVTFRIDLKALNKSKNN